MREMMVDLETLDVKNSALVLSIGAVVWESYADKEGYNIIDNFYNVLKIDEQVDYGRTISLDTIRFWMDADSTAREAAFVYNRTEPVRALEDFFKWGSNHVQLGGLNSFWAKPATFDFPIWEDLAEDFGGEVPWYYNQKYDVRSVVKEVNYSADSHDYSKIDGVPHTPVYDCKAQIDLLHTARVKLGRRLAKK